MRTRNIGKKWHNWIMAFSSTYLVEKCFSAVQKLLAKSINPWEARRIKRETDADIYYIEPYVTSI